MKKTAFFTLILTLSVVSMHALANQGKGPRHGKPPKEAIEACENKSEGEQVSFTTKRGHELSGTCKLMEEMMVAVPEGHEKRQKDN